MAALASALPEEVAAQALSVGELQAALMQKEKQMAVQEAQVAALQSALPADVAAAALTIGELRAQVTFFFEHDRCARRKRNLSLFD